MSKLRTNLTPDELEKVAKALLGVAAARRASCISATEILKAQDVGSPVKQPQGFNQGGEHEAAQKPGSVSGLAAPGNTAGPGRGNKTNVSPNAKTQVSESAKTNVSANAKTAVAGNSAGKEFVYLSKKDFPQAPKGTVDSTQNSWKLPAGLGRAIAAKAGDSTEDGAQPLDPASFNKQPKPPSTVVQHLKFGDITSKKSLDGEAAGASSSFKVQIAGNGSALMKPKVDVLYETKIDSRDDKPSDEEGFEYNSSNNKWEKSVKSEFDLYNPKAMGSFGSGNIPFRKNVEREASAFNVASLHGLDAHIPVTVARSHEGELHSLQAWQEGCSSIYSLAKEHGVESGTDWDVLAKMIPREKHAEARQKLMDLACYDILINNQDRHGNNYIVDKKGNVSLIDHGFGFGNSMHGSRNHMLQNMFHKNTPIAMSDSLLKNLKNKSLGDYKRAMPSMAEWESSQVFLRNRYMCWLQENHGTIDRQKFLNTTASNDGTVQISGDISDWSFAGDKVTDQWGEHDARKEEGLLPYQMFESWSKAFLEDASSNESHPDHKDAKAIQTLNPFMECGFPSFMNGRGAEMYRKLGKHNEYAKSIKASFDIPENVSKEMSSRRERKYKESLAADMTSNDSSTRMSQNDANTRVGSLSPEDGKTKR